MVIPPFYLSTSSSSTSSLPPKPSVISISSDSTDSGNQPNRPRTNPQSSSTQNTFNTTNPKPLKIVRPFLPLDDKPYNFEDSEPESSSSSNIVIGVAQKPFPPPGFKIKHMARKQPKDTVDLHKANQKEFHLDLFTTRYGGLPEGYTVRLPPINSLANQHLGPNEQIVYKEVMESGLRFPLNPTLQKILETI